MALSEKAEEELIEGLNDNYYSLMSDIWGKIVAQALEVLLQRRIRHIQENSKIPEEIRNAFGGYNFDTEVTRNDDFYCIVENLASLGDEVDHENRENKQEVS